ncbi:RES family NAD+ phosphorylase [Ekhidna sp.]|uniref:RES family NAD+ phosphorylase n=1 Tax=Ekhidna sp. TaxID=2608089 RepID=UPI0032EE0670
MIAFRLTLPKYANDLSGMGAALYGGRWNSIGNFVLYTAQTSSLSILEHLVHITGADSIKYMLTEIEVTGGIGEIRVDDLPDKWQEDEKITYRIGDEWTKKMSTPILKVPSVINPLECNYLINPNHPNLKIAIIDQSWFVYDHRLVRSSLSSS